MDADPDVLVDATQDAQVVVRNALDVQGVAHVKIRALDVRDVQDVEIIALELAVILV